MAKLKLKKGTTSKSVVIKIHDITKGDGSGLTGLVFNSSGLTAYYLREGGSPTAITLATLAAINSAFSSGGFKEADATNMPGVYRLDIPDAALATGAKWVAFTVRGAANSAQCDFEIHLSETDDDDAAAGGMTRLDAAITSRASQTSVDAVDDMLDTELPAITLAVVTDAAGTNIAADIIALKAETASIQADTNDIQARIPAALSAGGNIKADVLSLGGVVQSLTDLKDFADDGYDPATNKVQGVVLADTVTTYTGNTPQTGDSFARIGATGSGLTTLATQASVDDLPTNAELATSQAAADDATLAAIAALNNLSSAQAQTACNAAIVALNLDKLIVASGSLMALSPGHTTTLFYSNDLPSSSRFNDYLNGLVLLFTSGTNVGTSRKINDHVWDGAKHSLDFSGTGNAWPRTPTDSDAFIILAIADEQMRGTNSAALASIWTSTIAGRIDTTISSRASQTSVDTIDDLLDTEVATLVTNVAAILDDTGTSGVVLTAAERNAIADALLSRDMSAVAGVATDARAPLNALRTMRNKVTIVGTTITVYKEDDTTVAWTGTITSDAAANPITAVDPT